MLAMQPMNAGSANPSAPAPRVPDLHYRIGAAVLGHFPGRHRSSRGESGFEYRGQANLLDAPDPRRLDLHASLRDPFGDWKVRVYSQRKAVPVVMVADLSASMGFVGARRKLDVVADFAESLGTSAWRNGDSFGFVGCDAAVRSDLLLLPTRARGAATRHAQALRSVRLGGRPGDPAASAGGLALAHRHLGRQRALVFLVSDFHLPLAEIEGVLASMAHHDVVPLVVWDATEFKLTARSGLAHIVDPETGQRRLVWWRAALRERWREAIEQRRHALLQLFRAHRLRPLFIEGGFDADVVTRHFHS